MKRARFPALGLIAATLTGCAGSTLQPVHYIATDGRHYAGMLETGSLHAADPFWKGAVRASGAHDLRCPEADVSPRWVTGTQYVADGCGQRATYTRVSEWAQGQALNRFVLMGRFPLEPP